MFYFGVENLSSWLSSWLLKYSDCVLIFATLFHCKLGLVGLVGLFGWFDFGWSPWLPLTSLDSLKIISVLNVFGYGGSGKLEEINKYEEVCA